MRRMDFLARLRRYLERVGQAPDGLPYVTIDVAAHMKFWLETIEREWGNDPEEADRKQSRLVWYTHAEAFIQLLVTEVLDKIEPTATTEQLAQLVNEGIELDCYNCERLEGGRTIIDLGKKESAARRIVSGNSATRTLLKKAVDQVAVARRFRLIEEWRLPQRYAFENRLILRRKDRAVLSKCGKTLLEAPGMDGVRWLLALEAAQSIGVDDELHVSPELMARVVAQSSHSEWRHPTNEPDNEAHVPLSTVHRLKCFGLVATDYEITNPNEYKWRYSVIAMHLPLLEDIAQRKSTPYAILADALLRDETTNLVERAHPDAARMLQESAAATYALQARMVVHEIRNALVPAQVAFSSIATHLSSDDHPLQKRRSRVEGGIQRALEFVDNMLRVANLGVEQPSTFDVAGAVRDACVSMSRELNGGFQQHIELTDACVHGPRGRFVLAVTNLLRNAAQSIAGVANGRVSITTEREISGVTIHVDDNGPGVPETNRSVIFEAGVTLRPGGSGQGLALVRQVVEGEMFGRVTCTNAPLGGARFTILIPLQSRAT